jgi:hypothetical protein
LEVVVFLEEEEKKGSGEKDSVIRSESPLPMFSLDEEEKKMPIEFFFFLSSGR